MKFWPFRRRARRVVLVLSMPGVEDAMRYAADKACEARKYEARVRVGLIRRKEPEPPPRVVSKARLAFDEWIKAQAFGASQRGDYVGMWEQLSGERGASPAQRERALRVLTQSGAPLPGDVG